MEGWICLHRKLLDNPIATSPDHIAVWTTLLLLAQHKESRFCHGGTWVTLKAGQLLTGRKSLSGQVGVKQTKLERILDNLESGQQIRQQKTNKFRIITIVNWHMYQDKTTDGQQADNKETTNGHIQQCITMENNSSTVGGSKEKDPKGRKTTKKKQSLIEQPVKKFEKPSLAELTAYVAEKGYSVDPQEFLIKYDGNGWLCGKPLKPMESWKIVLYRWHKNGVQDNQSRKGQDNGQFNEQQSKVGITIKSEV